MKYTKHRPMTPAEEQQAVRKLGRIATAFRQAAGRPPENVVGRAFSLMLDVKRALTTGMILHAPMPGFEEGGYTITEASEDRASEILERAIRSAEQRGARRRARRCSKHAIAGMMATSRRKR